MSRFFSAVFSVFAYILLITSGTVVMISNTDIGRQGLCRVISRTASAYYDMNIEISEWNGRLRIGRILITNQNLQINVSGMQIKYDGKFSIDIDHILVQNVSKNVSDNSTPKNILQPVNSAMLNIRKYVTRISINHGVVIVSDEKLEINSCSYISNNDTDNVEINSDAGSATISLIWSDGVCKTCEIVCSDFHKVTGNIHFSDMNMPASNISADALYNGKNISLVGKYSSLFDNISCTKILLKDAKTECVFQGDISISKQQINGQLKIQNAELSRVAKLCNNDYTDVNIICNGVFKKHEGIKAAFSINNLNAVVVAGTLNGNEVYNVECDLSKLHIFNLTLKKLNSTITPTDNNCEVDVNITGLNWSVMTSLEQNETALNVNKLLFQHPLCSANISSPIMFKGDQIVSGNLDIKCTSVEFLKDLFYDFDSKHLSGNADINIVFHDGVHLNLMTDKLSYKNVNLYGSSAHYKAGNWEVNSNGCEINEHMLSDIEIASNNSNVSCVCDIDSDGKFLMYGKLDNQSLQITKLECFVDNASVKTQNAKVGYKNRQVSIHADEIDIYGGKCRLDIDYFPMQNKVKCDAVCSNVPLHLLTLYNNNIESRLLRNLTFSSNIQINNINDILVGSATFDVFDKRKLILSSTVYIHKDYIDGQVSYSNLNDSIDVQFNVPYYLSLHSGLVKSQLNNISVEGDLSIDLKNILWLSDDILFGGRCKSKFSLSQNLHSPLLNGFVIIEKGMAETSAVSIKNIGINAAIKNNRIDITRAVASSSKNGKIEITGGGQFIMRNGKPNVVCNMNARLNNFRLISTDSLNCTTSGNVKISGLLDQLKISGDMSIVNGSFDSSSAESENYSDIKIIRVGKKPKHIVKPKKTFDIPVDFDIAVKCKKFNVTGESINSFFNGSLRLLTFNNHPSMSGELRLDNGYINMVGTRIKLRSGNIRFVKERPFSPMVQLSGNSMVRDMQVFIDIDNTKSDIINIHSKPSYSIEHILSKIIFNKPSQELRLEESAKLREAIKNLSSRDVSFSSLDMLKELLFFDSFSFSNDESSYNRGDRHTVNAGKYLGDNIYLGIEKASEEETKYKVRVNVSPQVTVEANSMGEAGVNWIYRY